MAHQGLGWSRGTLSDSAGLDSGPCSLLGLLPAVSPAPNTSLAFKSLQNEETSEHSSRLSSLGASTHAASTSPEATEHKYHGFGAEEARLNPSSACAQRGKAGKSRAGQGINSGRGSLKGTPRTAASEVSVPRQPIAEAGGSGKAGGPFPPLPPRLPAARRPQPAASCVADIPGPAH